MDEECCRLCGDVIGADGGDGLCCECYFGNADSEWIREHYPHLLFESADDHKPRKRLPNATRSKSARVTAMVRDYRDQSAKNTRSDGCDVGGPGSAIRRATGGVAIVQANRNHARYGADSMSQLHYSPTASKPVAPFTYLRPGMTAQQLNAAARADRAAKDREQERFSRALLAAGAEAVRLAQVAHLKRPDRPWDPDAEYERLVARNTSRAKVLRHEARLASTPPLPSPTPRRAPVRSLASAAVLAKVAACDARIAEREAAATARRAEAALAKSLEPPPKAWLVGFEPCDFIGKEPRRLKMTWGDGERMWTTYEWTAFGEQQLAEGRA